MIDFLDVIRVIFSISVLLFLCWLISTDRKNIQWRPVFTGISLQFALAVIILWSEPGKVALQKISLGITSVVQLSNVGAKFVFGDTYQEHFIAFTIPATIIFFSALMALLFHLGIVQLVVNGVAKVINKLLPVSGAESLSACANIFIGNTEAPLLIKPYIPKMTQSEIMAMMTGGMATISGGMLALYVGIGIDPGYLLTASIMAAPASLTIAKIITPETQVPITRGNNIQALKSESVNIFQALTKGATEGLIMAANVIAMLIAFISLAALLNLILGLLPSIANEPLSVERILGWVFAPLAFLIGADWDDALQVGHLLGIKIFLGEFFAYTELLDMTDAISDKSRAVVTFALCGFGSFLAIGIQVGGISSLVPSRKDDIARAGLRCMLGGTLVTLISASMASLFIQ